MPALSVAPTARSIAAASSGNDSECRSRSAAERIVPMGLAMPRPAMSGAEPWIGSYRPRLPAPSEADGHRPSEPGSIDASSVRMSPNMFSVITTSKSAGLRRRCMAAASMYMCSTATDG